MRAAYCSIFLGNDPDWNQGLVHPLRVPHFRQHDKLACDHMPLYVVNKPRNHLIVSFQTAKGFKLLLRVKAGLTNQITESICRFNRRKKVRFEVFPLYQGRIDSNRRDFFHVALSDFPIHLFSVIRQWNLNSIVRIRRRIFFPRKP